MATASSSNMKVEATNSNAVIDLTKPEPTNPRLSAKLRASRKKNAEYERRIARLETKLAKVKDSHYDDKVRIEAQMHDQLQTRVALCGINEHFEKPTWDESSRKKDGHKLLLQDYISAQMSLASELVEEGDKLMAEGEGLKNVYGRRVVKNPAIRSAATAKWKQALTLKTHTAWVAKYGLGFLVEKDGKVGDLPVSDEEEDENDEENVEDDMEYAVNGGRKRRK